MGLGRRNCIELEIVGGQIWGGAKTPHDPPVDTPLLNTVFITSLFRYYFALIMFQQWFYTFSELKFWLNDLNWKLINRSPHQSTLAILASLAFNPVTCCRLRDMSAWFKHFDNSKRSGFKTNKMHTKETINPRENNRQQIVLVPDFFHTTQSYTSSRCAGTLTLGATKHMRR